MKPKTQKTVIVAASTAGALVLAAVVYLLWRKQHNGGLLVIGASTAATTGQNNSTMYTTQNSTTALQERFKNKSLPLGYRNNNPLNVLYGVSAWKGKVIPNTDTSTPRKEQFVSMAYGYRCAFYLLRKNVRSGYNTLAKLVNRWGTGANSSAVTSYVSFVSSHSGVATGATINTDDMETMCHIAYAMAWFENGKAPDSYSDIYAGWNLL